MLRNGEAIRIQPQGGKCVNDIRIVYEGGDAEELRGVDTCALTNVEIEPPTPFDSRPPWRR